MLCGSAATCESGPYEFCGAGAANTAGTIAKATVAGSKANIFTTIITIVGCNGVKQDTVSENDYIELVAI